MSAIVRSWLIEDLKAGVYEMHCLFDSIMSVSTVDQSKIWLSYDDGGAVNVQPTTCTMISASNSKYLKFSVDAAFRNIIQAWSDANKGLAEIKLTAGAFKDNAEVDCDASTYTIRCHVISLDLYTTKNYEVIDATSLRRILYLPRDTNFSNSDIWDHPESVAIDIIVGGGVANYYDITTNNTTEINTITIQDTADHVIAVGDPQDILFRNVIITGLTIGNSGAVGANFLQCKFQNCLFLKPAAAYFHPDYYTDPTDKDFWFDRCTFFNCVSFAGTAEVTQRYSNCKFVASSHSVYSYYGFTKDDNVVISYSNMYKIAETQVSQALILNTTLKMPIVDTTKAYVDNEDYSGLAGITLAESQSGISWSSGDPIQIGRAWNLNEYYEPESGELSAGCPKGDFCPIGAFQSAVTQNLTITGAVLSGGNKIVTLTTSETLTAADTYRVIVNNVEDTSGNIIEAGATEIFTAT